MILIIKEYPIKRVIGIGGTISTGGAIALSMKDYNRSRIHNYFVSLDIITTGFMILQLLLMATDSDEIVISEYDNLEGMFFDLYKK